MKVDAHGEVEYQVGFNAGTPTKGRLHERPFPRLAAMPDGGCVMSDTLEHDGYRMDWRVTRFDAEGRMLWQTLVGGELDDTPYEVSVRSDGTIIVVGGSRSWDTGMSHGWVVRLDDSGQILDQRQLTAGRNDIVYGHALRPDGGLILTGYYTGGLEDPEETDTFILSLNEGLNVEWARSCGGNGRWGGWGALALPSGKSVVVGYAHPHPEVSYIGWLLPIGSDGAIADSVDLDFTANRTPAVSRILETVPLEISLPLRDLRTVSRDIHLRLVRATE
jgi:hypothetical protein